MQYLSGWSRFFIILLYRRPEGLLHPSLRASVVGLFFHRPSSITIVR
jgi:hypothetical protein